MYFETWSIHCINVLDPILLLTIAVVGGLAWLLAPSLVRLGRRVPNSWLGATYLSAIVLLALLVALVAPRVLLGAIYPLIHGRGNNVCTHFVWPALFLPATAGLLSAAIEIWRMRRRAV